MYAREKRTSFPGREGFFPPQYILHKTLSSEMKEFTASQKTGSGRSGGSLRTMSLVAIRSSSDSSCDEKRSVQVF